MGRLLEIDPDVKGIVSTGYPNDPVLSDYRAFGSKSAVAKSFEIEELSRILHKVMVGIKEKSR